MRARSHVRRYLLAATVLVGLAALWWLQTALSTRFSVAEVRTSIAAFGSFAPLMYMALLALFIIIPPMPDLVLVVPAGLVFGFIPGTLYTLVGALLGASVNFWLARRLGRAWLRRRLGPAATARVETLTARRGWVTLFLTRLVPGFPFQLISYAAGLTGMSWTAFLTATLAGMILPASLTVAVGANARARPDLAVFVLALGVVGWALVPLLVIGSRRVWTGRAHP